MNETNADPVITLVTAKRLEGAILALCGFSLIAIFQPFSELLFGIGAGLVVLGGLAFNLMPLCQPGVRVRTLVKAALIVAAVFVVVVLLAMGSAELYGVYLRNR